jgi:hypothetical protein
LGRVLESLIHILCFLFGATASQPRSNATPAELPPKHTSLSPNAVHSIIAFDHPITNSMAETFQLFMKLPKELRFDIWQQAQAGFTRVVEFTPHRSRRPRPSSRKWNLLFPCTAPNIILSVSREARDELLRHYVQVNPNAILPRPKPSMGPLLVCPSTDTFLVNLSREMAECLPQELVSSILEYVFGDKAQVVRTKVRSLVGSYTSGTVLSRRLVKTKAYRGLLKGIL